MACIKQNKDVGLRVFKNTNGVATTLLHLVISTKGHIAKRVELINTILDQTPEAASLQNGYGSHPVQPLLQRNKNLPAHLKDAIIRKLIKLDKDVLYSPAGPSERFPLHVVLTGKCRYQHDRTPEIKRG